MQSNHTLHEGRAGEGLHIMKQYIQPTTIVEQVKVENDMMVLSSPGLKGGGADDSPQYSKERADDGWDEF